MNSVEQKGDDLVSIANTARLEHQIDAPKHTHDLGSMMEKKGTSTSPVDRLPPEILHQFFQYLRELKLLESGMEEDEIKLAQSILELRSVCKYWLSVIDGGGKGIWTACAFRTHGEGPPHEERVQQWILRAGNHPLQTVLHMRLGRSLETFWRTHLQEVCSRISSIRIVVPDPQRGRSDDNEGHGPVLCGGLRVLESANFLTRLFLVGCRYHPSESGWEPLLLSELHLPALRYLYIRSSFLPLINAPALDTVFLDEDTRATPFQLLNLLRRAPRTKVFNNFGRIAYSGKLSVDINLTCMDHLVSLFPCCERFLNGIQIRLLRACQPSVLRILSLSLNLSFGRDAPMRNLPIFDHLQRIRIDFDTCHKPVRADLLPAITELIILLAKAPNVEEFALNTAFFGSGVVPDLLIQAFLIPPQKFCPRLSHLSFKGQRFNWPSLVREVFRVRSAADSEKGGVFKLEIHSVDTSRGQDVISVTLGPGQTPEDREREFDMLVSKFLCTIAEMPETVKPVFAMETSFKRLQFLCRTLSLSVSSQDPIVLDETLAGDI